MFNFLIGIFIGHLTGLSLYSILQVAKEEKRKDDTLDILDTSKWQK